MVGSWGAGTGSLREAARARSLHRTSARGPSRQRVPDGQGREVRAVQGRQGAELGTPQGGPVLGQRVEPAPDGVEHAWPPLHLELEGTGQPGGGAAERAPATTTGGGPGEVRRRGRRVAPRELPTRQQVGEHGVLGRVVRQRVGQGHRGPA